MSAKLHYTSIKALIQGLWFQFRFHPQYHWSGQKLQNQSKVQGKSFDVGCLTDNKKLFKQDKNDRNNYA